MTTNNHQLIFDRAKADADGIELEALLPDGAAFKVPVLNIGEGLSERAIVRAEVSGSALALQARSGQSLESWLAMTVTRTANSHENDGNKLRVLVAKAPLRYDSRYVLD